MYQYDIEIKTVRTPTVPYTGAGPSVVVKLSFYPLVLTGGLHTTKTERLKDRGGEEWAYYVRSTDKSHTLQLSASPRGPKQREAVDYLIGLVVPDRAVLYDYSFKPSWCASQSVLEDAPQVIQDFMATLPVRTLANA
jgi:hypothetical protein